MPDTPATDERGGALLLRGRGDSLPPEASRPSLSNRGSKSDSPCRTIWKDRLLLDMLGEIPVESHLIDRPELCLEPVDMLFGIFDHIFKHVAGGEITDLSAVGNGLAE